MPLPRPARLNIQFDALELWVEGVLEVTVPVAPEAAADAVRELLAPRHKALRLDVVIAAAHVRLFMLPFAEALNSESRWRDYAIGQFARLYEDPVDDWILRVVADAPPRPRLAVALPRALFEALESTMGPRLRSIHVDALGRAQQIRIQEPRYNGALLDIGPSHALLMFFVDGVVRRVRARRVIPTFEELQTALKVEWAALAPPDQHDTTLPCLALGPGVPRAPSGGSWQGVSLRVMELH